MSIAKKAKIINCCTSITLYDNHLTRQQIGKYFQTVKYNVSSLDGLQWMIQWYPTGVNETCKGYVSIFLYVNKPVKAQCKFVVGDSSINCTFTYDSPKSLGYGPNKFTSHDQLRPLLRNGMLTVICSVEFEIPVSLTSFKPSLFLYCDHVSTDFELILESKSIPVHKHFLSMLSPVFHAMLTHNTLESQLNNVKITDFKYETAKAAIDLCYGRELENPSVETLISIFRFTDKYDIKLIADVLMDMLLFNLSAETFLSIVQCAHDCSNDKLLAKCATFFVKKYNAIKTTDFSMNFIVNMLKSAFQVTTTIDVLQHANKHKFVDVVDHLEKLLLEGICLENFCTIAKYAWDCSREDIKIACATFLNDNCAEVTKHKEIVNLSPQQFSELLNTACEIKLRELCFHY